MFARKFGLLLLLILVMAFLSNLAPNAGYATIIFVSTTNTIVKIDTNGGSSVLPSGLLANPTGLAFDSAGNLYAGNYTNNTIVKFTPAGVGSVFASTGLNHPEGIAFDASGNLYAANAGNNTIEKFTSAGIPSVFANSGLSVPSGLAFDSAGNLYASNYTSNTIEKFTPAGVPSSFGNDAISDPSAGINFPYDLHFDGAGNLFVTNSSAGNIVEIAPNGKRTLSIYGVSGNPAGGLSGSPTGVTFDNLGNLYTIDNATLHEFNSSGTLTFSFNTGPAYFLLTQPGPVPEPGSLSLLGLGAIGVLARRRSAIHR